MNQEAQLLISVYKAKKNMGVADELIRDYMPFIKSETSKILGRYLNDSDDELSIAMIAFHEAILAYDRNKGSFLRYVSLVMSSRIKDYHRKEYRHSTVISYDEAIDDDGNTILDTIGKEDEHNITREATREEIEELSRVLKEYNLSFLDIADNCPKQERTLNACASVINYCDNKPELLNKLIEAKRLPISEILKGVKVDRKTLERHRKYLMAMLIIRTNGFEIIRGHLHRFLKIRGQAYEVYSN